MAGGSGEEIIEPRADLRLALTQKKPILDKQAAEKMGAISRSPNRTDHPTPQSVKSSTSST